MATEKAANPNFIMQGVNFLRDSVEEVKKVHAPTREETVRTTLGVLLMVLVFAVFLGATDWLVGYVMQKVLTS
jgi:preprotein translocase SecE subunit